MRKFFTILKIFAALGLTACGNTKVDVSPLPQFRYYVESKFTGQIENNLIVEGDGIDQLTFKLSGHGFTAEVPLDVEAPVRPKTRLQYVEAGDYAVIVQFFKSDGTPLLRDSLKWSFSLESPDNPIAGFANSATNDSHVVLLISASRDPQTNEIWVEGDLSSEESPSGSWRAIPSTSNLPLHLTEADGMKTLKIKLRNDFKNETEVKTLQILKKSHGPTNCKFQVKGTGTVNRMYELVVSAENDGPLFYRVFGDVSEPYGFQPFKGPSARVTVKLSPGVGVKNLTVQIKDAAENYCLREDFKVNSNPAFVGEGIFIKNNKTWTDVDQITVQPWIDHFADDTIEMYIHGDVVADSTTFRWIPWSPEVLVTLQPADGNRWVRVQFRVNGQLSSFRYTPVYLKPQVIIRPGIDSPYRLVASSFINLENLTITGCTETYNQVAFAASYRCTPNASSATITYLLKDGSSVSKSANFPP